MTDTGFTADKNEFEQYSFVAEKGQKPLRVDKFLMNFIEGTTRSKIQIAIDNQQIRVNNSIVKANYKVKPGDEIKVILSEPPRVIDIKAENLPLAIVYEDESVVVINKEAGMVVHPGHGNYSGTLVNALKYHFENLPSLSADLERPGLVHRIDKDTSGLLVIAKTEQAMQSLTSQFKARTTDRLYEALVWGNLEEENGTIEGNIGRHLKDRMQMAVFEDKSQGKPAITHFKVLERFLYVSRVECKLETGRTHQIRVHFKHIGHPLFNDERYGGDKILKGTTFTKYKQFIENCFKTCPRQVLHAKTLGFDHPQTGKRMSFEVPIPKEMEELFQKWRNYTQFSKEEKEK
ncbi:MAG: RluA family pseudouridine synthase [Weeksellaceae bacterium]|jgi:23S rRNA pseudouridine1911/1915/1917 synthase|nr:RluA family pseudouridine synthase [Weeksellaceae bacterium]MDX9705719.1 RluA family pseudouridine synthase [Weeksellaceae bacterium]